MLGFILCDQAFIKEHANRVSPSVLHACHTPQSSSEQLSLMSEIRLECLILPLLLFICAHTETPLCRRGVQYAHALTLVRPVLVHGGREV